MKRKIVKIGIILGIIVILSFGIYFGLKALGVTDIETLRGLIAKTGGWSVLVYCILRIVLTIILCFVPAISMIFDLLSVTLFENVWLAFLISMSCVLICSLIMYFLGRFGATKLLNKLIGESDMEKANTLLKEKGIVFYPIMMACGGFPDDAIVCMAGVSKMNLLYFIPSTIIGRGIGCAFSTFGISLIPFETFTRPYDWLVFGCCIVVIAFIVIKGGNWLSKKIVEKKKDKEL